VFFGRFTAALRVLVPGLAGMSEIPFPTFLAYNFAGGALWGSGFVLLGYAAGAGWRRVERYAGRAAMALLAVVTLSLVVSRLAKDLKRLHRIGDRLAATPPMAWIRRRLPRQASWMRRRLDPWHPTGFPLSFALAVAALAAWAFGGLTQDVVDHDETAKFDPRMARFVLAHRAGWLTASMQVLTWVGSNAVLIPVVVAIGGWFAWRRSDWRPAWRLALVLEGAVALGDIVKPIVARPRPPVADRLMTSSGWAYPSGHATQAVAVFGMAAMVLSAGRPARARALAWATAALVAFVAGASRVYLGVH